nr:hypothetical protein [Tanacetum cinerariifolium]
MKEYREEGLVEYNISSILTSFTDKMTNMEGQDGNNNYLLHMVQESSRADGEGNLYERVVSLRHELDEVQKALDKDPLPKLLRGEEAVYLKSFNEAGWIEVVKDLNSILHEVLNVPHAFVDHYTSFLGVEGDTTPLDTHHLFSKKFISSKADHMIREVKNEEIKAAMFDIGNDKAPCPDGYTSVFFKKSWDIVRNDVCNAVQDFFSNEKLLQKVNHSILALIPKVSTPSRINDYRHISCCNIIYKCISKIITNRLKEGLDDVVSKNQSAFILGPPRCAFKFDIQKAYDTVHWRFLKGILIGFGFHTMMVSWIMAAATIASSLEAEQYNGNMDKTQSKATPNEASSLGTTLGGVPRYQDTMRDTIAQTRVLDLEKTKTSQALEITSLKKRVKKLEKKQKSRTYKLKRLYEVGLIARVDSCEDDQSLGEDASKQGKKITYIDANEDITLVNDQDDAEMFDVNDLDGEEVFVEKEVADKEVNDEVQKFVDEVNDNTAKLIVDATHVSADGEVNATSIATTISAAATITTDEITLAQALVEIKTIKPKAKGIVLEEPSESITTITTTMSLKKSQDKGKRIMTEEPMKLKKKDQIRLDGEVALKL